MDDNSGSPLTEISRDPHGPRISFFALFLIVIGALMFLDNLGFIPHIRPYWPLAISFFGIAQLIRPRRHCSVVWPLFEIAAGVLLTLGNLQILNFHPRALWPLALIALGLSMLGRRRNRRCWNRDWERKFRKQSFRYTTSSENFVRVHASFSGVNRRVDTQNFEGADLDASFGELKVDLRGAAISSPNHEAIITTNAAFGAIKIRIPETWRVVVQGDAVFGAYEDKTVPPRPAPGVDTPTLIIRGNASFGAVEIEN